MYTLSKDFRGLGLHIQYNLQRDIVYIQSKDRLRVITMSYYDFMLHLQNDNLDPIINQLNTVQRQLTVAAPIQLNYIPPTTTTSKPTGDNTMGTGVEYLAKPFSGQYGQSYTHLRTMLHVLWEHNRIPTNHMSRCIPDVKFGKDARRANAWIRHWFSDEQINHAHIVARTQYSGRGRKPGALSQRTIDQMTSGMSADVVDVIDLPAVDETLPTVEQSKPTVSGGVDVDLSNYVTKPELKNALTPINNDIYRLQQELGTEEQVRGEQYAILKAQIEAIEANKPTIVTLARPDVPNVELGQQHYNFPDLLGMCSAVTIAGLRLNVWLHGPAGTGKSTAGKMVAKAFGLPYYSLGALETGLQITGYLDAAGVFQTMTPFYKCWKEGGVIMLDEIDAYTPSALLALNGALVDSTFAFACGMVDKHKDCIIIGSANTVGLGGTSEYTGRMKQDAANRNRWVFLDWEHDNALEDMLCPNKEWLNYVRKVRDNLKRRPQKGVMITMRASIYGESLLRAGRTWERTVKATLRDGMSDAQWEQIA